MITGSVLPVQRAEELLSTLPGVIAARIVAGSNGVVEEIHILTTDGIAPKQTVRNVESALIAHLGMRVSHKKISVATSSEARPRMADAKPRQAAVAPPSSPPAAEAPNSVPFTHPAAERAPVTTPPESTAAVPGLTRRRIYFEHIEVRRGRTKSVACRVTLRKGDQSFVGVAEGLESERLRIELAARAALAAIVLAEADTRVLGLEGCRMIEAFDREYVFVGVHTRVGRDTCLLTGTAEVKESPETSSVLAVLDATNRWIEFTK